MVTAYAITAPLRWGYYGYSNPYCGTDDSGGYAAYSEPIAMAPDTNTTQLTPAQNEAVRLFDMARSLFMQGNYNGALDSVNKAIQKAPTDAVLHEFRALCEFARGVYKPAAATLYAVESAGPGWDWATLISLYPSVDVYTQQLRALEKFSRENPTSAEAHFVLAYHYMTAGHNDAAIAQFKKVIEANPEDALSKQLLNSLSGAAGKSASGPPKADVTVAAVQPVAAADVVGNWKASRAAGSEINMMLGKDNKYTWKYTNKGKTQSFSGMYTLTGNSLTLKDKDQPMMVSQISLPAANQMKFKLVNGGTDDPGLTFSK